MLKAVIFDMDGVLIDSEPLHCEVDILVAKKYGVTISEEYTRQFIGSTNIHVFTTMISDYKIDATVDELMKLQAEIKDSLIEERGYPRIPYSATLIKNLYNNGLKLAVASSSSSEYINEVTTALSIKQYFDKLVSGETVPNPKPAPDVFLKAVKELNVNTNECIIIEDSYNGVCASVAAGIKCIGFVNPNSGNQDLRKANALIETFQNIDYKYINNIYNNL